MASWHRVAVAAALLTASLAACDSDNPPTTPPTVSFPEDPAKAPKVPAPIDDPEAFVENPCASLSPEQQKKYNLDGGDTDPPGYTDPPRFSDTCFYSYTNSDRWIKITYTKFGDGLQELYVSGTRHQDRWEPQVVDGYPAVATYTVNRIGVPSVPPSCLYHVGMHDHRTFRVLAQDSDGSSECGLAKKIAADVLATIKANQ